MSPPRVTTILTFLAALLMALALLYLTAEFWRPLVQRRDRSDLRPFFRYGGGSCGFLSLFDRTGRYVSSSRMNSSPLNRSSRGWSRNVWYDHRFNACRVTSSKKKRPSGRRTRRTSDTTARQSGT